MSVMRATHPSRLNALDMIKVSETPTNLVCFTETDIILLRSQVPATGPCYVLKESSPRSSHI